MGPVLKCGLYAQWDATGENCFLFLSFEMASGLDMRTHVHFSQCLDPVCLGPVPAATVSEFTCVSCLGDVVSVVSSILTGS